MLMVPERVAWAGLVEEAERLEREDDAWGPEPESVVVTRTVLPGPVRWEKSRYVAVAGVGADELRVRAWLFRWMGVAR